jgi:hypothetical protein
MMAVAMNDATSLLGCKTGVWNKDDEYEDQSNNTVPSSGNLDGPPLRKIFVGNLSANVSDLDLLRLFCLYGLVVDVRVSRDTFTQAKKMCGYVTYKYPQDAINVLKLRPGALRLDSRNLVVAAADRWHQPVELPDGTVWWWPISRVGAERGESKIDILNDDCLMQIFSFLSMRERVKVERVCKRWQTACLASWAGQKHLDFKSDFPLASAAVLNTHILQAGLKRCGKYLKSLSVSRKLNSLDESALGIVASTCKRLRCLKLAHIPVTSAGLRSLSVLSHQLIALSLDGCSGFVDKDLQNLFMRSPHLESVTLYNNNEIRGKCLFGLAQAPLRKLVLHDCENLEEDTLLDVFPALKGLKRLSLNSSVRELTIRNVDRVIGALPNLRSLSIGYFPLLSGDNLAPLDPLSGLLTLDLQENHFVTDEVIEAITRSCHRIEELNISGCNVQSSGTDNVNNVTEYGYMCLSQLPNLVKLYVSDSQQMSDKALKVIASRGKLQKLVCPWCPSVTKVGCTNVITLCKQLEYFDFRDCDVQIVAVLRATADVFKLRPHNLNLIVLMGDI